MLLTNGALTSLDIESLGAADTWLITLSLVVSTVNDSSDMD